MKNHEAATRLLKQLEAENNERWNQFLSETSLAWGQVDTRPAAPSQAPVRTTATSVSTGKEIFASLVADNASAQLEQVGSRDNMCSHLPRAMLGCTGFACHQNIIACARGGGGGCGVVGVRVYA